MRITIPKPEQESWEEVQNRELYLYLKIKTIIRSRMMNGTN